MSQSQWDRTGPDWTHTQNRLPPEKIVVDTISEGGQRQDLLFYKNLWWFADMSMYVYYVPQFWRHKHGD